MGKTRNLILSGTLLGLLTLTSLTNASEVSKPLSLTNKTSVVQDKMMMPIYQDSTISIDYEYNAKHYFTKKVNFNTTQINKNKVETKRLLISLVPQNYDVMYYTKEMSTQDIKPNETSVVRSIDYTLPNNKVPKQFTFNIVDLQDKLSKTGRTYQIQLLGELTDGSIVTIATGESIYLSTDNVETRERFLEGLEGMPVFNYSDQQRRLDRTLSNIQNFYKEKYPEILKGLLDKTDSEIIVTTDKIKTILESVQDEKDFGDKTKSVFVLKQKMYVLSGIKDKLTLEISSLTKDETEDSIFNSLK